MARIQETSVAFLHKYNWTFYWDSLKCLHMVSRSFSLLLLFCLPWSCLAKHTILSSPLYLQSITVAKNSPLILSDASRQVTACWSADHTTVLHCINIRIKHGKKIWSQLHVQTSRAHVCFLSIPIWGGCIIIFAPPPLLSSFSSMIISCYITQSPHSNWMLCTFRSASHLFSGLGNR